MLGLMAEGASNAGIARQIFVAESTVEKHVRSILTKLNLPENEHRRVLAVLRFLEAADPAAVRRLAHGACQLFFQRFKQRRELRLLFLKHPSHVCAVFPRPVCGPRASIHPFPHAAATR
jgi:hypothetical protein